MESLICPSLIVPGEVLIPFPLSAFFDLTIYRVLSSLPKSPSSALSSGEELPHNIDTKYHLILLSTRVSPDEQLRSRSRQRFLLFKGARACE